MLSVARPVTSSTLVSAPRLTAAVVAFRVAVVAALCSGRNAVSVLWEFRPRARQLGELRWLCEELHRQTGTPLLNSRLP